MLRQAPELAAERRQLDRWLEAAPDRVLALVAQMDDPTAMPEGAGGLCLPDASGGDQRAAGALMFSFNVARSPHGSRS